ncbi:3-deoxy-manno-octulosonate cytidylyltransferase [Kordiimonas marina]|uniref:3-deoxy-manno-octulosonate cytidylyltransferase n=1 Tax=Kordiimonas marina TaxID=2872312 RepID=UPI001FF222EE|nr:3-deoxy-manno-octulosonate cytidylyltransferase [Kordiimonas marina]MCJ9428712.1 3-deoxy-manno-octulosonate cytidylyltransferase [Kordiimonas marina]
MKIVIPARYASTRLPGKPLADIAGKPMIQHVWDRAQEAATDADDIFVAADDARILKAVEAFGGQAVPTRDDHLSGTDRIAEVAEAMGWADDDIVVNVQGDEPLMPPALIRVVGDSLKHHPAAAMSTASHPIREAADITNPNMVKVVTDKSGFAAYFSRAAIPHHRGVDMPDPSHFPYQRHIGIYAYRVSTLKTLTALPPAPTELLESLEQLRALWNGLKIMVVPVAHVPPAGVDTPEDLEAVRCFLEANT